jgi:hypothetical protein
MEASEATSCLELGLQTSFAPVQHGPRFGEVAQPSHLHAPPFAASVIHDDEAGSSCRRHGDGHQTGLFVQATIVLFNIAKPECGGGEADFWLLAPKVGPHFGVLARIYRYLI